MRAWLSLQVSAFHHAWLKTFVYSWFINLGALWLIVEFTSFFKPEIGALIRCWHGFWLVLAATGAGSIYRSWPSAKIEFPIPLTDSSFAIKFGDIFDGEGVVVIPVNEYFDGVLGKPVSKNSLHGKFIEDVLGGHSKIFFDLTRKELAKVKPKATEVIRTTGPNNQYEIGTVVQIDYNDKCYLLAVLSHTDLQTLKASATVDDLWICLTGVWNGIREHYSGGPARIPLFGSGSIRSWIAAGNPDGNYHNVVCLPHEKSESGR